MRSRGEVRLAIRSEEPGSSASVPLLPIEAKRNVRPAWPFSLHLLHAVLYCDCRRRPEAHRKCCPFRRTIFVLVWGGLAAMYLVLAYMWFSRAYYESRSEKRALMDIIWALGSLTIGIEVGINSWFLLSFFEQQVGLH
jgi:hypothetical protein